MRQRYPIPNLAATVKSNSRWLLVGLLVCASLCTCAAQTILSPLPRQCFLDNLNSGKPLASGKIYTCTAGLACPGNPLATYTDSTGSTPNANPITLDVAGCASIWLTQGSAYKFVAQNSAGLNEWTTDNVTGIGTSGVISASSTVAFSATPTFTVTGQNQLFKMTLTGNVTSSTLNMGSIAAPSTVTFEITQDGTGGRTFAWPANVTGAQTINAAANAQTIEQFTWDGTSATLIGAWYNSGGTYSLTAAQASFGIVQGVANPLGYGALGNGVHDDTAAINAAMAASASVFIPPGHYIISSTLTPAQYETIQCAGPNKTFLHINTNGVTGFTISNPRVTIENCGILADATNSVGVNINASLTTLRNDAILNDGTAFGVTSAAHGTNSIVVGTNNVYDVNIFNTRLGELSTGDAVNITGNIVQGPINFYGGVIQTASGYGIKAFDGSNVIHVNIYGTVFQSNALGDLNVDSPQGLWSGGHAEGSVGATQARIQLAQNAGALVQGLTITGWNFSCRAATYCIVASNVAGNGTDGLVIIGNTFQCQVGCTAAVQNPNGTNLQMINNRLGSGVPIALQTDGGGANGASITVDFTGISIYQGLSTNTNTNAINFILANNGTGTTLYKLAKLNGSQVQITATTDTFGVAGIAVEGTGTTGTVKLARMGFARCVFDAATTAGDFVQISATVGGDCHDAGGSLPASGQILGRVLSTNGGGGTYIMLADIHDTR